MKGLTYSQFADSCGIPRPSLSQLLTGRNKKISDVMIGQIHNMFPDLSIVWLLFGEGPMETGPEANLNLDHDSLTKEYDHDLDSYKNELESDGKKIVFQDGRQPYSEILQGKSLKNPSEGAQITDIKLERLQSKIKELQAQIENLKKNPRKAVQITVYYDDSTFETFFPR